MTQYAVYDPYRPASQSNGLGLAGFICSIVGLITGGLLSPIGLILSLVALGRQPRGFAIAGLIIGLIGSCGGLIVLVVFGALILATVTGAALAAIVFSEPQKLEVTTDMVAIAIGVEEYRKENHYLPASLDLLNLSEQQRTDPWGTPYKYVQKDDLKNFDLVTAGEDKAFETKDDVRLTEIDKMWSMSKGVKVRRRDNDSVVQIDLGGSSTKVEGDETGGSVKIDVGGKTIEVKGEDAPTPPAQPAPPVTPTPPAAPGDAGNPENTQS